MKTNANDLVDAGQQTAIKTLRVDNILPVNNIDHDVYTKANTLIVVNGQAAEKTLPLDAEGSPIVLQPKQALIESYFDLSENLVSDTTTLFGVQFRDAGGSPVDFIPERTDSGYLLSEGIQTITQNVGLPEEVTYDATVFRALRKMRIREPFGRFNIMASADQSIFLQVNKVDSAYEVIENGTAVTKIVPKNFSEDILDSTAYRDLEIGDRFYVQFAVTTTPAAGQTLFIINIDENQEAVGIGKVPAGSVMFEIYDQTTPTVTPTDLSAPVASGDSDTVEWDVEKDGMYLLIVLGTSPENYNNGLNIKPAINNNSNKTFNIVGSQNGMGSLTLSDTSLWEVYKFNN